MVTGCEKDNCELEKQLEEIRKGGIEFQRNISTSLETFQNEMRRSVKEIDSRHTRARDRLETELRSEFSRGIMTTNAKMDGFVKDTNAHLISISGDLGQIKGALGLKDETAKLRTSVMNRVEETKKEAAAELAKIRDYNFTSRTKILYLIISLLTSGLSLMIGYYISN